MLCLYFFKQNKIFFKTSLVKDITTEAGTAMQSAMIVSQVLYILERPVAVGNELLNH